MIKKLFLGFVLWLFVAAGNGFAQTIEPVVEENVELMSIVSRLAGYGEYLAKTKGDYFTDIDRELGVYAGHPLILFLKEEARERGIGFDAVMSMALRLDLRNGAFVLVDEEGSALDGRWKKVPVPRFLELLSDFYTQTSFHDFFVRHRPFFDRAAQAYRQRVMGGFDQSWYPEFYGVDPVERFQVVLGLCNGSSNYGVSRRRRGEPKEVFAIVGYDADQNGEPQYDERYLPTLIHEFNHSFVNPLLDADRIAALEESAGFLFRTSEWNMRWQAYADWRTMVNESVVRAAVIRYMQDRGDAPEAVDRELTEQMARGFRWMPELVAALRDYNMRRDEYPTIASFYPQIIRVFDHYAQGERKRMTDALSR